MKARPTFNFFPANAMSDNPEHIVKISLALENGVEMFILIGTDKTDAGGFIELEDLSQLLSGLGDGLHHLELKFKQAQFPGMDAPPPSAEVAANADA